MTSKSAIPGLTKKQAIALTFSIGDTNMQMSERAPFSYILKLVEKVNKADGLKYMLENRDRIGVSKDSFNLYKDIIKLPSSVTINIDWGGLSYSGIPLFEAAKIYAQKRFLEKATDEDLTYLASQHIIYDLKREQVRKIKDLFIKTELDIKECIEKSWSTIHRGKSKREIIIGRIEDKEVSDILFNQEYDIDIFKNFILNQSDILKKCPEEELALRLSGSNFSIVGPTRYMNEIIKKSNSIEKDFIKYVKKRYKN